MTKDLEALEAQLESEVLKPLSAIQRSHDELKLRLEQRAGAAVEYDKAVKGFQAVARRVAARAAKAGKPEVGSAGKATRGEVGGRGETAPASAAGALASSRAWLRSLRAGTGASINAGEGSESADADADDDAAEADAARGTTVASVEASAAAQAQAVARLSAAQTRLDVLTEAITRDIAAVTAPERRREVKQHLLFGFTAALSPFFSSAGQMLRPPAPPTPILRAVTTAPSTPSMAACVPDGAGATVPVLSLPGGAMASTAAAAGHPWWDEGSVVRHASRAFAEAQRERRLLDQLSQLKRDVPYTARARASTESVLSHIPSRAIETLFYSPLWLARIIEGLTVRDVGAIASTCSAMSQAVMQHPHVWAAAIASGGLDAKYTHASGWSWPLERPLSLKRHVKFWSQALGLTPRVHRKDAAAPTPIDHVCHQLPHWSCAYQSLHVMPGARPSSAGASTTGSMGGPIRCCAAPFRALSLEQFQSLVALAKAESAAGGKRRVATEASSTISAEFEYDESSRSRWSVMIDQDVVRCYTGAVAFGDSSALVRLRMSRRNSEETGGGSILHPGRLRRRSLSYGKGAGAHASGRGATVQPRQRSHSIQVCARSHTPPPDTSEPLPIPAAEPSPALVERRRMLTETLMAAAVLETNDRYSQGMCMVMRFLLEVCALSKEAQLAESPSRARQLGQVHETTEPPETDDKQRSMLAAFNLFEAICRLGTTQAEDEPSASCVPAQAPGLAALFGGDGVQLRLYQLHRLLLRYFPAVADKYCEHGLGTEAFATPWLVTLCTNFSALGVAGVLRVWDCFVLVGWRGVFAGVLALVSLIADDLEDLPMEECVRVLAAPRVVLDTKYPANAFQMWARQLPRYLRLVDDTHLQELVGDFQQQRVLLPGRM